MRPSIAAAVALFAAANADTSTATAAAAAAARPPPAPACRNLPGDPGWPSAASWAALNKTLNGRLIATVPLGTPCHDPKYNQNVCANLQADWELPQTHYVTSSSIMQPFFANQSCDAFTPESQPCLLGNYVSYAVNVSCTADVSAALAFATKNNIRVVVRNTGHDFFGRSTGAGALGIWTHNLKNVSVSNWSSKNYTGPAITVGAGIQGFEILEAAHAQGLVAITGECPTVGVAGGFTQGGGHSALSTQFGLGADQTLEFEVVTAAGTVLTASPSQNSDLYWALSGGGPGYGVVTSMTVKAHPETVVGGAQIDILAATTTPELFNQVISEFYAMIPTMIDQGAMVVYLMNNQILEVKPITVWNSTGDYVQNTVLAPFTALLNQLGVPATIKYTTLSYFDHYATYMGPLPYGSLDIGDFNYGSRLIPRSVLVNNNDGLQAVIQNLTAQGVVMAGSSANYARPAGVYNAVLPAWRNTSIHLQIGTAWNNTPSAWPQMIRDQNTITNVYMPQLEAVTPGSGIYMNEGDFQQPNFQQEFFGSNYNALLAIKKKYDPNALFWGNRLVGSESWTVASNGRMCRAS